MTDIRDLGRAVLTAAGLLLTAAAPVWAGTTERVSVSSAGSQGDSYSYDQAISADGRFVAFHSRADNLVPGDTDGADDIFVRDRRTGRTERVSVSSAGRQGDGGSFSPSISADGRFVAFASRANNLVPGDTNGVTDVFVRDRLRGTTERVSVATDGAQGDGDSGLGDVFAGLAISADGRHVAFLSDATDLARGDTNGTPGCTPCGTDAFVRDLDAGTTERVSVSSGGRQANGDSGDVSLSADARFVAFSSVATNLVPGDTNGRGDVFVRDRRMGHTERVSVAAGGRQANDGSWSGCISDDGAHVVFASAATDLVPGDTNGSYDVFVRDWTEGTTERVSMSSGGAQGDRASFIAGCNGRMITPGGRYVVFESAASDLVRGDTNGYCEEGVCTTDVFVRDRLGRVTTRVSVSSRGIQGDRGVSSFDPSISTDGHFVAFSSAAANLVPGDTNGLSDVVVRTR